MTLVLMAVHWSGSGLISRTTSIKVNRYISPSRDVVNGVTQVLVLGPALNIYCIPIGHVIWKYNVSHHMYANDTQLYMDFDDSEARRTRPSRHYNHVYKI